MRTRRLITVCMAALMTLTAATGAYALACSQCHETGQGGQEYAPTVTDTTTGRSAVAATAAGAPTACRKRLAAPTATVPAGAITVTAAMPASTVAR